MKKAITLLLVLCLVFSMAPFAYAAGITVTVSSSNSAPETGEEFTVEVRLPDTESLGGGILIG